MRKQEGSPPLNLIPPLNQIITEGRRRARRSGCAAGQILMLSSSLSPPKSDTGSGGSCGPDEKIVGCKNHVFWGYLLKQTQVILVNILEMYGIMSNLTDPDSEKSIFIPI